GGYAAGPVVWAARSARIPYVIHSVDSVPPKSSAMFAGQAAAFTSAFRSTQRYLPGQAILRTGQPIRKSLRDAASQKLRPSASSPAVVLVVGGSQGSEFLNTVIPEAALEPGMGEVRFVHATGPKNYDSMSLRLSKAGLSDRYDAHPYLQRDQMIDAL